MKSELSILMPAHDNDCTELARCLCLMADRIEGLRWELIVADDGSKDVLTKERNRSIGDHPRARVIENKENIGRARIRNLLVSEAQYQWLLFIDSDRRVEDDDFLKRYLETPDDDIVVSGGICIGENTKRDKRNLRYIYELAAEEKQSAAERRKHEHEHFLTTNFMARRDVMTAHPFDERFHRYGYEDVLFGKQLKDAGIGVAHIDNAVAFGEFEDNTNFVRKTEEGLATLMEFRDELRGYSALLDAAERIDGLHLGWAARLTWQLSGKQMRRNLTGEHPRLWVFKVFKLLGMFGNKG